MGNSQMDMHDSGFVSIRRMAEEWATTKTTVRRVLKLGGIKAYRFSGKEGGIVRYRKSDVDHFVEQSVEG